MNKVSYPNLKEFGQVFWKIFNNVGTKIKVENIKQLNGDGWLKGQPPAVQYQILQSAPKELMKYFYLWKEIHPETLRMLGISTYVEPDTKPSVQNSINKIMRRIK